MEARGRQEGGLAAMSQLGFDLSVDEGGGNYEGDECWWCDVKLDVGLRRLGLGGARLEAGAIPALWVREWGSTGAGVARGQKRDWVRDQLRA